MAFDTREVFASLSCEFPRGRVSVILGGSGSGKSTILRLIGGLIRPQSGSIEVAGVDVTRLSERGMYDVRKRIGMLFQGGALLDSLTVFDNIAFPLREHTTWSEGKIAKTVHERLDDVGLSDVDHLLPPQLSGGMLRRAALARAIIMNPEILLCDEPFSGLDPISVKRVESLLSGINHRLGITLVVVSHHIASTLRMADHVLLLVEGRVVAGTPRALRDDSDPQVADFFRVDLAAPSDAPAIEPRRMP
ncbi:MAG TPA: ATP-binding cassette domain-containing protein [Candidatus Bathyarchaeia archaeon]|nr:ATP-binding cassette domain-containing protein [Candidatus Bathyarchaeia archaeon]